MVMITLIVILICIGKWDYALSSSILFLNIIIGVVQEVKAKWTAEKLVLVTRSVYTVTRGAEELQLGNDKLQKDDFLI